MTGPTSHWPNNVPANFTSPVPAGSKHDKPLVYPADFEVKRISGSGFLAHEGKTYHVGEAFAHKRVGLHLNSKGQTQLHFANVHLGNLTVGSAGRFRPAAYIAPPNQ